MTRVHRQASKEANDFYFMTGSRDKFSEAEKIIPDISQLDEDLPEIQELDPKKIIEAKLIEAAKRHSGRFFCEDTSLCITCINGLPGTLVKWFLKAVGSKGVYDLVAGHKDNSAVARTLIGYKDGKDVTFFEGLLKGKIVSPKGANDFGWGDIFQPDGSGKTFAEMSREEKNKISMRKAALEKLKDYLKEH